jgi:lipopolysaccharide transport system permease protein
MISSRTFKTHLAVWLVVWRELISLLIQQRRLTVEMAKREITDRYLGQVFGVFWAFGHPLALMAVYVFIFAVVFKVKIAGARAWPLDYATYLLSGLIPWLSFQESMVKGSTVIVTNANLVKQVIFPVEILPVKGVIASLITQVIFLIVLIVYVLVTHYGLLWTYILLPVLIIFQALAMIGVSYILAAIGTYFRDIKDFVQVFSVIGIYLLPVFYLPEFVPKLFQPILYLNPFSYLTWCYQDVLYFGQFEHWWAWPIFMVLSMGVFVSGYRLFRKLKVMFGNVL